MFSTLNHKNKNAFYNIFMQISKAKLQFFLMSNFSAVL